MATRHTIDAGRNAAQFSSRCPTQIPGEPHSIVILEGYSTGVGWDELCVDGNCCPSCVFLDLVNYDTYKLVIDVAEQKYQVYMLNPYTSESVVFDNFNNPPPNEDVHDWRYYQGPGRLEKLSVVFGGNTLFGETQNVSFDDFTASGGTCADSCAPPPMTWRNQTCLSTDLPFPASQPACENDPTLACCPDPSYCVLDGECLNDPFNNPNTNDSGTGFNITCQFDTNNGVGIWCPQYFTFNPAANNCTPVYSTCDTGFAGDLEKGCDAWWQNPDNPEESGPDYYNQINNVNAPWCLQYDPPPWEEGCCFFQNYMGFNSYQEISVNVYNPS